MEDTGNINTSGKFYKKIFRFFLWLFALVFIALSTGVALVFVYEDDIKSLAINELNKHLRTEVRIDPKDIDITFISSFPKCALEFKNITAFEALEKKNKDTLLHAKSIQLKFNIRDIFAKKYVIRNISIHEGSCFLKVDKIGRPNYLAWESKGAKKESDSLQFKLKNIEIEKFRVIYKDKQKKWKTDFTINDLTFEGEFSDANYRLSTKGSLFAKELRSDKTNFLSRKSIKLDVELEVNDYLYKIARSEVELNKMKFEMNGAMKYIDSLESISLNYKATNLDIAAVLSLLPEKYKERIDSYESSGRFYAEGDFNYDNKKPFSLHSLFGVQGGEIEYKSGKTKLHDVVLKGEIKMKENESTLALSEVKAVLNEDRLSGNFTLTNFNDPSIKLFADGSVDLKQVYAFWPIDTIEKLEGRLKFNGDLEAPVKALKQYYLSPEVRINLLAELQQLKLKFKHDEKELTIESCTVKAVERDIKVEGLKMLKGKSDIELNGEMPGIFDFVLNSKAPLVIKGELFSNYLDVEDFIHSSAGNSASASEFHIPGNVRLTLDAKVKQLVFNKFSASNINGNFDLKDQRAMLGDMHFETMDGHAFVDALADVSGEKLDVALQAELKNINVNKMFIQLNNFGQATLTDKNINGFLNATINFSGKWDKWLKADLKSIISDADILIDKGELNNFKPLESLSKFVEIEDLKRIRFSSLTSHLQIKNKTIYIPETSIKNSALNIDFSGQHDFDNNIDYHIRLLISDLLAKKRKSQDEEFGPVENDPENRRSAFILMKGNIDNISIKYDGKGLKKKIREDIKHEKQNLKTIFKEEFGWFKKDSMKNNSEARADQKFQLEKPGNNSSKKPLEKEEEDDDVF